MRQRSVFAAIATILIVTASFVPASAALFGVRGFDNGDYAERDEINQTYDLSDGADISIYDISGPVEIQNSDGNKAELHVVRSARNREDLEYKKIVVEHTATSLSVHTEKHEGERWGRRNVRQKVTLRLPARVNLRVTDVAGSVRVGTIDGRLQINDVAGAVSVDRVNGSPRINDIAGAVSVKIGEVGSEGIHINDIAGRLEVVLGAGASADVEIVDIAGKIDVDIPNVTVLGKIDPESFHGKIGGGGPQITINDIAGSVTLRN